MTTLIMFHWIHGLKEVVTLEVPFRQHKYEAAVMFAIVRGERPARPPNMKDWLWPLITQCWAADPAERPTMRQVLEKLQAVKSRLDELQAERDRLNELINELSL
jgi:acyl carrier protein phosphodiesterase